MFKCRICGCNCDNADIINGICDDCRKDAAGKKIKQEMMHSEGIQMEFDFCLMTQLPVFYR